MRVKYACFLDRTAVVHRHSSVSSLVVTFVLFIFCCIHIKFSGATYFDVIHVKQINLQGVKCY